jgi:hypothetical protein
MMGCESNMEKRSSWIVVLIDISLVFYAVTVGSISPRSMVPSLLPVRTRRRFNNEYGL